jgi:hypothetical protein
MEGGTRKAGYRKGKLRKLKATLKRGALVAAANWPLIAVQFIAESTLELLVAVPVVGGIVLVVLLLDAEVGELVGEDVRFAAARVMSALGENPVALVAFVLSFLVVVVGASILTFIVKSGTVAVLAQAEAGAGPIERAPLRLATLRRTNRTAIDPFLEACQHYWRRYVRLGLCLLVVYGITAALYLPLLFNWYALAGNIGFLLAWSVIVFLASSALVVWLTIVSVMYLLTQMVITVEDIGVRKALRIVFKFVRARLRELAAIFGVILLLVGLAIIASVLGTAGLGLISWVPFVALAVMPLQIAAWLLRGFVFQYIALTALVAYLTEYRQYQRGTLAAVPGQRLA